MPAPRPDHQHVDVDSPEAAATYLRTLYDLVGPVETSLVNYHGRWICPDCGTWRLAP